MADLKTTKTKAQNYEEKTSLLERERRRLRRMQIVFALFCAVLILSMLLALAIKL